METQKIATSYRRSLAAISAVLLLTGLYLTSLYSYLLFHSLAEVFSVVVACGIFMVAWNSRGFLANNYLLFLGLAYLFIGGLDLVHTLAYKGMGIFSGHGANLATQLWIGARYVEALTLLIAPFLLVRKVKTHYALFGYSLATAFLLISIFYWNIFPDCFLEGIGLTAFKKVSEYVICLLLAGSIVLLFQRRGAFDKNVFRLLIASIVLTILAELAFTFYISVYGFSNLVGHYLKIISFYLIYRAIIATGLEKPYSLLFSELKQKEESIRESREEYRTLFNSAADLIAVLDTEGNFLDLNERFEEDSGYKRSEMVGKNAFTCGIITESSSDIALHFMQDILAGEQAPEFRIEGVRKDGDIIPYEIRAVPIKKDNKIIAVQAILRDVTERKLAEDALKESESRFRSLFDHCPFPIWEQDFSLVKSGFDKLRASGIKDLRSYFEKHPEEVVRLAESVKILDMNRESAVFFNVPSIDHIPRYLPHYFDERSWDVFREEIIALSEGKLKFEGEMPIKTMSGDEKILAMRLSVVPGHEETLSRALFSFVDITGRVHAEGALKESEERFRALFEGAPDAIFLSDPESGRIIDANQAASKLLLKPRDEIIGMHQSQLHPEREESLSKKAFAEHVQQSQKIGPVQVIETVVIRSDGVEVPVEVMAQLMPLQGRQILQGVFRDVSQRKRLELQLQRTQKMEAIANLAGGIAHQFNNALSVITINLDLLEMDLDGKEGKAGRVDRMQHAVHRMVRLTSRLLAYARGGKYQPETIRLGDLVSNTLPLLEHTLKPSVHMETRIPDDIRSVKVDLTQMQMVISAILSNASEAIEDAGRIRVECGNEDMAGDVEKFPGLRPGPYACLSIEDDGRGMDEETRSRIFEPFFTSKFEGRGLGMAASYGIVKNHGGWISVDSELERGTTVRVYLPATRPEVKRDERPGIEPAEASGTIFVIEDEEMVMDVNGALLEKLGYRVLEARTGKEAIEIARTFDGNIDLAILDMVLPDMSGADIYPLLMEARPDLKVIVCSGYSIDGPAQRILDAGARGFIQKPFSFNTLSKKLKEVLEGDVAD